MTFPVATGGHFFVRFASPVGDGLPGSFWHIGLEPLPGDAGSCAFETDASSGEIANASTTSEPRMVALLLMRRVTTYQCDGHVAPKATPLSVTRSTKKYDDEQLQTIRP
jgi:hypothetical protein